MCEFFNLCKTQIPFKEKRILIVLWVYIHSPWVPQNFETQVFHYRLEKKLSWVKIKEESLEKEVKED